MRLKNKRAATRLFDEEQGDHGQTNNLSIPAISETHEDDFQLYLTPQVGNSDGKSRQPRNLVTATSVCFLLASLSLLFWIIIHIARQNLHLTKLG